MQRGELFHVMSTKENKLQLWLHPQTQYFFFMLLFLLCSVPADGQYSVNLISAALA